MRQLINCFSSVLPLDHLKNIDKSVFLSYFSTIGKTFQPDSDETREVISKITSLAETETSQDDFLFTSLKDLGLYYNTLDKINDTNFKTNGIDLIENIKASRDPKDYTVQLCRMGLTNDDESTARIKQLGGSFVDSYLKTLTSRRRRRSTTVLSCDDLNNIASSLNSISTATLNQITDAEFQKCMSLLGNSNNDWSSEQLSTLGTKAKAVCYICFLITVKTRLSGIDVIKFSPDN